MSGGREVGEARYAWVVLGAIFFAQAVAMGARSTIGILVRPWEAEFGWDRAAISLTASVGFVVYGAAQALAGRWADALGPRRVFAGSLAVLGVGVAALGSVVTLWQAYLTFGVLVMVGVGGASSPSAAVAIARWFRRRRGLAIGLASSGSAAGQLVLLPAMAAFAEAIGWRPAFGWFGAGIVGLGVPLLLVVLRDEPAPAPGSADGASAGVRPLPVATIARQRNFWWLALSFFVCGVTTAGLIDPHLIPHAQDHHIPTVTAATAFGLLSLVNMVFTTVSGLVADRVGYRWLLGWIYAGRAAALLFLPFARDPLSLFLFAVAFGIVDFSTVPPTTALSTLLFGRHSAGTVYGLVALAHQIGSAAGSYAGGVLHDLTGTYTAFFLAGAALSGAAALMAWAIAEPAALAGPAPGRPA